MTDFPDWPRYDFAAIRSYYRSRPGTVIGRAWIVLSSLLSFAIAWGLDGLRRNPDAQRAQRLRKMLTHLGPTFIKVGQSLSTRPDLVRSDFVEELTTLQDQLPRFSNRIAFARIIEALGQPLDAIFADIEAEPVAAASLGQVYKAKLLSGETVAIKVQRPNLLQHLSLDIYILRWIAGWIGPWLPLNLGQSLTSVVDEFGAKLFEEIDYIHEGQNCEQFAHYFEHDPQIYVPKIYWAYTARRVLTLEWIEGIKLNDTDGIRRAGLDIDTLVRAGVSSSLQQLLEYGFFHADPHPGNLFALADGRLAFIDFGMMDQLSQPMKECLVDALVHLVNQDYERLIQDFIRLGFLSPTVDTRPLGPAMQIVLSDILDQNVQNFNFRTATLRFSELMYAYPFRIPPNFALIIRSLVTLEGVALSLSPQFKIVAVAYPYVAKRLLTDESPAIRQRLLDVLTQGGHFHWQRLESLIQIARLDSDKPNLTLSAQLGLSFLLSAEGDALRQQLVLALTEGDRFHVEEVQRLWDLVKDDISPAQIWEVAVQTVQRTATSWEPFQRLVQLLPR